MVGAFSSLLVSQGVFVFSCVSYSPLEFNGYLYPKWGQALGWLMAVASMLQVPLFFLYKMVTTKGTFREVRSGHILLLDR